MAAAGFGERRFPDGRVLRLCSNPAGSTISAIGREIGITRQGAAKVVAHLSDRGYVSVADSASSGREKSVTVTPRGIKYLEAQRSAAQSIEVELRSATRSRRDSPLCARSSTRWGVKVSRFACVTTFKDDTQGDAALADPVAEQVRRVARRTQLLSHFASTRSANVPLPVSFLRRCDLSSRPTVDVWLIVLGVESGDTLG